MIADPTRLREVVDEIANWTVAQRRQYLTDLGAAFGKAAVDQLKDALREKWEKR